MYLQGIAHLKSAPSSNTWFHGPTQVHTPNGVSINSAVFAGITVVSNRQRHTDRPRRYISNSRLHFMLRTALPLHWLPLLSFSHARHWICFVLPFSCSHSSHFTFPYLLQETIMAKPAVFPAPHGVQDTSVSFPLCRTSAFCHLILTRSILLQISHNFSLKGSDFFVSYQRHADWMIQVMQVCESAFYISCQRDTYRFCCWALCCCACCRRAVQQWIHISCPPGAEQQTRRTPLLRSNDGTDGRMDTRPFHKPCSAYRMWAVSVILAQH